jgi:DNA-binding transcriptional LysR family regulator
MKREDLVDLNAFRTVAEESSFTHAAARLGTSQSAVSTAMRRLEERLGIPLLIRTTRQVTLTEAGERLLATLGPALSAMEGELEALMALRDKPAGTVRITTSDHAARAILWPAAQRVMTAYPDIRVEISIESALTDIVTHRFDAGIRLGERLANDMVAVRIGGDVRMAAVAAPEYLANHHAPASPEDLSSHLCVNIRTPTHGGIYAWEFEKDGRDVKVRVEGQFICNDAPLAVEAAKAGFGIAYVPDYHVGSELTHGSLIRLMEDWCPTFSGFHLYYPSRRQKTPAFSILLDELRQRG